MRLPTRRPLTSGLVAHPPPIASAEREELRLRVATYDYPRILFSAGGLVALFSLVTYFTETERVTLTHVNDAVAAAVLLGAGILLTWGGVPVKRQPWIFAGVGTFFLLSLLYNVTLQPSPVLMTYVAVVLGALGPCTLAWRPYVASATIALVAIVAVTVTWPEGRWVDWTTACLLSACVGCLLLGARLRGIHALADVNAHARDVAIRDQLTGLLNRHGFMDQAAALASDIERSNNPTFVVFVDIEGLKQANDQVGHDFGDKVIQAAAAAVRAAAREGDLVVRWGGDEIVVLGLGRIPEAVAFNQRLQSQRDWAGEIHRRWKGGLSVGFAEGLLSLEAVEEIVSRADEDMYRRRARSDRA